MNNSKTTIANNLKEAMRQLPFPVTIVTTAIGKEKRGITIGSFTSLSLDPPLISFNVDHNAQIHNLIKRATHYAVHIPRPNQSTLCNHFSISGQSSDEQFNAVEHFRNPYGTPILENISTVIQCRSYERVEAGDHTIIIGEVVEVQQQEQKAGVLYYDRSYRSVGQTVPQEETKIKRAG
jgi:flavin reductase (DIM6/NTAB) family NADH-FMN oxidoreductase RutF